MPRKHDYAKIRNAIGALDFAGVEVKEIVRRLAENEAGVGYAVKISPRQVYYYRKAYRDEHGSPREQKVDRTGESLEAMRDRAVALIRREIDALEGQAPGALTRDQSRTLREHHRTLCEFERRENAQLGKPRARRKDPDDSKPDLERELTTAERIAQEESAGEDVARVGNGQ